MTFGFQVTIQGGGIGETPQDITEDVIEVRWALGMQEPYQEFADDQWCEIDLNNTDGYYTPESDWSDLGGILTEGVTVKVYLIYHGTATQMWTGYSRSVAIDGSVVGPNYADVVTLMCSGPYGPKLRLTAVGPFGTDKDTGALMVIALLNAGFVLTSKVETGQKIIADFTTQMTDISILNAMQALTQVERGKFFFDRTLLPVFWDRHYLFTTNLTPALTVDSDPPSLTLPYAVDYQYSGLAASFVRVTMNPTNTAGSSETLWELDTPIEVGGGEIDTYEIQFKRAGSEQVGRAVSLGTTGETWLTSTTATITVTGFGSKGTLQLDNSANTQAATLTALTVTGTPVVSQSAITYEKATGLSNADTWEISIPALAEADDGKYIAQFEAGRRGIRRGDVYAVEFLHIGDGDNNAHHVQDFGARVRMNLNKINHMDDYFMIGEEHTVRADGYHWTRLYLEPANNQQFWLLGQAGFSELDDTTTLGY